MLTNNLRTAYRSLIKNRLFSYINIAGLAIGLAAFLLIIEYVRFERSYETFHENSDQIFRLATRFYNGSEYVTTDCETYAPLGPLMKEKFPEVTEFARMYGIDGLTNVKSETQNFLESGLYWADHSVFNVFTHDILKGDISKALIAPFEVVLTETMALKYFNTIDVVGESIEIDKNIFRIKAVIADVPPNTHLKFSFLLSRLSFPVVKPWYPDDKWNNNNEFTYILTPPGTDAATLNLKLNALVANELRSVVTHEQFVAEPIRDIHLYSTNSYEPEPVGNGDAVYYLTIIAVFLIIIAWVNYVNLSTSRAVERAREVGIRKVIGSHKAQLIVQFLTESFVVNVLAGIFALIILQLTFPLFRQVAGQPLRTDLFNDQMFWVLFAVLIAGGTILAGLYPAFVLSSFKPAAVLKGKFQTSSHGRLLRRGLVIFQFSATAILLVSVCTVYLQVRFLRSQDLGMDIDQVLVLTGKQLNMPDSVFRQTSRTLKTELLSNAAIKSVARGESLPGVDIQELSTTTVNRITGSQPDGGYLYYFIGIDGDYATAMNIKFAAGNNFTDGVPNHDQVIINEEAATLLGFPRPEDAVGSRITFRTRGEADGSTIIGVLKDFHFRSPKEAPLPMLFYYHEPADYFALKVSTTDMHATVASVQQVWNNVYPGVVFNYFFLNEKYNQQYRADTQFGVVTATFSGLIVLIACLGLFGLSSYTISQRTKEIGIRKILGASVTQIVRLLSIDFLTTIIIATLIALPISYLVMDEWLSQYHIHIQMSPRIFVFAIVMILVLAMVTVSFQTFTTARSNPTDSLRQE